MSENNLQNSGQNYVEITINDQAVSIHRGRRTVEEIKIAGQVPLNHMLEQLIDGTLTPLKDDGSIVIKGGEVFISHIKDGGSV